MLVARGWGKYTMGSYLKGIISGEKSSGGGLHKNMNVLNTIALYT